MNKIMKINTDVNLFPEESDALIGHVWVRGGSGEVTPRFYPVEPHEHINRIIRCYAKCLILKCNFRLDRGKM
jgi:hypothetical protein